MFETLGLAGAALNRPDGMLEKGAAGCSGSSKQLPLKEPHHKPCRLKGNGSVCRAGDVLC
jgi:hypothetical protein